MLLLSTLLHGVGGHGTAYGVASLINRYSNETYIVVALLFCLSLLWISWQNGAQQEMERECDGNQLPHPG